MRGQKVQTVCEVAPAKCNSAHGPPQHILSAAFFGSTAEITTFSDVIVVYKFLGDLMFYVTGSQDENELILYQVLQGFYESISLLLRCSTLAPRLAIKNSLPCSCCPASSFACSS